MNTLKTPTQLFTPILKGETTALQHVLKILLLFMVTALFALPLAAQNYHSVNVSNNTMDCPSGNPPLSYDGDCLDCGQLHSINLSGYFQLPPNLDFLGLNPLSVYLNLPNGTCVPVGTGNASDWYHDIYNACLNYCGFDGITLDVHIPCSYRPHYGYGQQTVSLSVCTILSQEDPPNCSSGTHNPTGCENHNIYCRTIEVCIDFGPEPGCETYQNIEDNCFGDGQCLMYYASEACSLVCYCATIYFTDGTQTTLSFQAIPGQTFRACYSKDISYYELNVVECLPCQGGYIQAEGEPEERTSGSSSLLLTPNPASISLHVKTIPEDGQQTLSITGIEIYDLYGEKEIQLDRVGQLETDINISSLENGVYLVRATLENGEILTKQFVKE